jgi:GDP-D-mannose dehydratase
VLDDEYVTATGEANSVRSLIGEICRQAGIDLRTYTAPDRRYAGHLEGEPLADALRRILRSESYLVGVRLDAQSDEKRMTWLHVLASNDAAGGGPPAVSPSDPPSNSPRLSSD